MSEQNNNRLTPAQKEASKQLAEMGGTEPQLKPISRRRSEDVSIPDLTKNEHKTTRKS